MPNKLLVFNIEVEDVYASFESKLIEDVFYLKYYYWENKTVRDYINRRSRYEFLKFCFQSYRFNGENFTVLTHPLQNICIKSEKGFYPKFKTNADSARVFQGIKEMNKLNLNGLNRKIPIALKRLKKLCEKHKTELVIIYGPNYYYPKKLKKGSIVFQKYCRDLKIKYLDFSLTKNSEFSDIELWHDHIHLNHLGAEKYSVMLRNELRKSGN